MRSARRLIGSVSLIGLVFVLSGCKGAAVQFNDKMAIITRKMETLGKELEQALQTKDGAKMKSAYDSVKTQFEQLKAEAATIEVPNLTGAAEFHDAFKELMKNQESAINNEVKEIVDMFATGKLEPFRLMELGKRLSEVSNRDISKLGQAQAEFAKANGIKIK